MSKFLWLWVWINLWVWKNFVDMEEFLRAWNFGYGKFFLGMWCWIMENFVVMILDMWEYICAWTWTCGNFFFFFFYGYLDHVGIFSWWLFWTCRKFFDCVWLWKKFGNCVWTCEKFLIVVKFLVGALIFFFWWEFLDMWFWSWNNGLNFYVAEPQESG